MRFLVFVLFLAWLFGGSWYWTCKVRSGCNSVDNVNTVIANQNTDSQNLKISYQGEPIITSSNHFDFVKSSPNTNFNSSLSLVLDSLAKFLFYNPYTQLVITGHFSKQEETNNSDFSTLGLARSHFIAQELYNRGIDPNKVIKSYKEIEDSSELTDGILHDGISFHIFDTPPLRAPSVLDDNLSQAESSEITDSILLNPPLIYFAPNSTYLPLNDTIQAFINKSISFLRRHNDRDLMIIGHSDDQGNPEYNANLGLERARSVKDYFVEFGLNEDQIMVLSRGETEPLSTNDTEINRTLNRRVELSIK